MFRRRPRSTRTYSLFPFTALFRSPVCAAQHPARVSEMAMVAAACALGLLTGLLVCFSTSGVTASVVSALLAMAAGVAALTGVKNPFLPTGDSGAPRSNGHNWTLFPFALLTELGRAHV